MAQTDQNAFIERINSSSREPAKDTSFDVIELNSLPPDAPMAEFDTLEKSKSFNVVHRLR
jgi:hypothetical protein